MKKACVLTNGCPENQLDSTRMQMYLEKNRWQLVGGVKNADVILFNACALTESSESNSIHSILHIKKQINDKQRLIVWGCLPKINPDRLLQTHQELSFGEREVDALSEILNATQSISDITVNEINIPKYREGIQHRFRKIARLPIWFVSLLYVRLAKNDLFRSTDPSVFYIKVATGCLGNCSYCAIKKSRGRITSKPIETILDEFKSGLRNGFKEFSLLGTDLGPYGRDLGYTLTDLLTRMVDVKGDFKIGLRNIHPLYLKQMINELVPVFATGKIWFAGAPIESGSDRILKLMQRGYSVGDFKECVRRLKEAFPGLFISTQIMVNFPTETAHDFAESIYLFEESLFDYAEIYSFSPRPGTAAADIDGRIPHRTAYFRELKMVTKAFARAISFRVHPTNEQRPVY